MSITKLSPDWASQMGPNHCPKILLSGTADCYRALNLYNCRKYDEVLHQCERIMKEPDLRSELKKLAFANVLVIPPLDSFFDRDVQSLLGFHTLFYYLFPLNDDLGKLESIAEFAFEQWFAKVVYHGKKQIGNIIQDVYSIKCQYVLGRHFLARYLKMQCCIDSNLPYKEALTEFCVNKTNLPFEHMIRRFLLRKLRT